MDIDLSRNVTKMGASTQKIAHIFVAEHGYAGK
jgi:hypothetical protein